MLGNDQFVGHDVFADNPHMLPGRRGGDDLGYGAAAVDIFDHDHRIGSRRHHIPRVHDITITDGERSSCRLYLQLHRRGFLRAERIGRPHGDPVHGGAVVMGGGL